MANSFTHFAFTIPVDEPDGWFAELTALCESLDDDPPEDHPFAGEDSFFVTAPEIALRGTDVEIHDGDGEGDLDTTVRVVQWILNQPGTPDSVTFAFACTCDQQRADAFSGGLIKVTADADASVHTSDPRVEALLDTEITAARPDGTATA